MYEPLLKVTYAKSHRLDGLEGRSLGLMKISMPFVIVIIGFIFSIIICFGEWLLMKPSNIGPCHVSGIFLPLRVKSLPLATIYEVKIPLRKWKKSLLQRNPAQMTSAIDANNIDNLIDNAKDELRKNVFAFKGLISVKQDQPPSTWLDDFVIQLNNKTANKTN
jgi:hypothetical protein